MAMQRSISALPERRLGIPSHAERDLRPHGVLDASTTRHELVVTGQPWDRCQKSSVVTGSTSATPIIAAALKYRFTN